MTDTETTASVERPELLTNLDGDIEAVLDRIRRLEALGDEVEDCYAAAADLDEDAREVVAEEMPSVRHKLTGADTIEELEAVRKELVEVVTAPHRQAVERALKSVMETLDLAGEVDPLADPSGTGLDGRSVEQLQTDKVALEQADTRLQAVSDAARTVVADLVRDRPAISVSDPTEGFTPIVETIAEQHGVLEAVDEALADTTWAPSVALAETEALFTRTEIPDDEESCIEYIENVDDAVERAPDRLPLEDILQAHLKAKLTDTDGEPLRSLFDSVNETVADCLQYSEQYEQTTVLVEAIEEDEETSEPQVPPELLAVDELRTTDEAGEPTRPLNGLEVRLTSLAGAYEDWAEQYAETLADDATAVRAIQSMVEWAPPFEPPADGIPLSDTSIDQSTVSGAPAAAVATDRAYREWVEDLQTVAPGEGADGEGAETVTVLLELVRGGSVPVSELEPATFSQLAELLENGLELQFAGETVVSEE